MIEYYDVYEDPEQVQYKSIDEAIESYIDNLSIEDIANLPKELTIYEFEEEPLNLPDTEWLLTTVLDNIDEDYLPEYMDPTEPTDIMRTAAEMFLYVIEKEYKPRAYKSNSKIDIITDFWLENNNTRLYYMAKNQFPNGRLFNE